MDALSNALSGLRAASLRLDVAGNNVANVNTPGFTPDRVLLETGEAGGVTARVVPGEAPPAAGAPEERPSGTDLVDEAATLVEAPLVYGANAQVVRADEQTTGYLLDVLA